MVRSNQKGFTLLELLIVMALIAILIGIVIAALNPARQFAIARNSTRYSHINTLMNALSANMAENNGVFVCASAGTVPATATLMGVAVGEYDIAPCLVTEYLSSMPFDPSATGAHWVNETDYETGYRIVQDAQNRITIDAPSADLAEVISLTR